MRMRWISLPVCSECTTISFIFAMAIVWPSPRKQTNTGPRCSSLRYWTRLFNRRFMVKDLSLILCSEEELYSNHFPASVAAETSHTIAAERSAHERPVPQTMVLPPGAQETDVAPAEPL